MKIGHIIGGNILFIYDEPKLTSRISGYIGSLTEVTIVTDKAVNGFYKVSTIFGIEGYCECSRIRIT